jgi:hypothetical protein
MFHLRLRGIFLHVPTHIRSTSHCSRSSLYSMPHSAADCSFFGHPLLWQNMLTVQSLCASAGTVLLHWLKKHNSTESLSTWRGRSVWQHSNKRKNMKTWRNEHETLLILWFQHVFCSARHGANTTSPIAAERVFSHEAFSCRLPSNTLLRDPTKGWHVTLLPS